MYGAHLDIGNSQYSCTGTLQINGGTVNAKAGLVMGSLNAGYGVLEITNGGTYASDGFNFVGYSGDATINVEGEDSSLRFSGVLQLGGGDGVGVVNIENGAAAYGNSLTSWDASSVSIAESACMSVTSVTLNGESTLANNGSLEGYLEAGFGTTVSGTVDKNGNIIINTVVPEPATATLSLLALAAMVARRRR